MKVFSTCMCIAMLAAPSATLAFTSKNRLSVVDIGNATFEVIARGGTGEKGYWCAAGDYSIANGAATNARVYVVNGPGPSRSAPGRRAVQFTLNPSAAGVTPIQPQVSLSTNVPGDSLRVASAQQYCFQGLRRS